MLKRCSRCKQTKPMKDFKPDVRFSSGRRPECRVCAGPARRAEEKKYRETPKGHAVKLRQGREYFNSPVGREARRLSANRVRAKLKLEVITAYCKGEIQCPCCKEDNLVFLTIDHVNGGGRKHRDEVCGGQGGTTFYRWLKKNDYPGGFGVLCFNCNMAKHVLGVCPHQTERKNAQSTE